MADRYIYTRSYTYEEGVTASTPGTSIGTNTPAKAIDDDKSTGWETADALPQLKIDLGVARFIDSVWFRSANAANWQLYYSTDDIAYFSASGSQAGNADGYNRQIQFPNQIARYWRLDITTETTPANNSFIYEVFLMEHLQTLTDGESLSTEFFVEMMDAGGGMYRLADGHAKTFSGMTGMKRAYNVALSAQDAANFALVQSTIENNGNPRPVITADFEPDDLSRVMQAIIMPPPIQFKFSGQYEGAGRDITFRVEER